MPIIRTASTSRLKPVPRGAPVMFMLLLLFVAGCGSNTVDNPFEGAVLPGGFDARIVATGFNGPTQMLLTSNGELIIAELNGAENDATGRILQASGEDFADRTVLQDGLDKPTGIAVVGDRLWIMERRRLSFTMLTPGAERTVVADELPFNGRSQGTLTALDDGSLLYDTSGSKRGAERVPGSATIFQIQNAATESGPALPVATGFKHAYTQLVDGDGQLWSVEMTDGRFDEQRALDELVAVTVGDDAGWPQCVDDNRPVVEFGGTAELCASAPRSHALFDAGATPTSFVVSPWDADEFIVALWLSGDVVTVPRTPPSAVPHQPTVFITGIESPQHLLVDDSRLLISDHETGRIIAVTTSS